MSIAGKAKICITPYHDAEHDGTAKMDELKRIFAKLKTAQVPKMKLGMGEFVHEKPVNPVFKDRPGRKTYMLEIPDNLNFWAQLVLVPTLLTPYFWKKTAEELAAERVRLTAGDAWAGDNWLKLAERFDGDVCVRESYDFDGYAEHDHCAYAKWNDEDESGTCFAAKLTPPNLAPKLAGQIASVKALAAALEAGRIKGPDGARVTSVEICKDQYWGMFE